MAEVFRAFLAVILAVVAIPGVSAQTHHFVGGDDGWVPEMNVSSWLAGRVFRVGDKLWFTNSGAAEGILEVHGPVEFEACDLKNPIKMYTDHVALEEEGMRYFVSGKLEPCKNGLKLPVPVESDLDTVWSGPTNPTHGFEPFDPKKPYFAPPDPFGPFDPQKPDLAPPEPDWPTPGAFPPDSYEPPSEYEPPLGPYDPPAKPSFPPPSQPSGATVVEGAKVIMIVGLLIGCFVGV